MSNGDDEGKIRDNTDRPLKPDDAQRLDRAQRGSLGNERFYQSRPASLSLGGSQPATVRQQGHASDHQKPDSKQDLAHKSDYRPTGDADVDRFYGRSTPSEKQGQASSRSFERGDLKNEWAMAQKRPPRHL